VSIGDDQVADLVEGARQVEGRAPLALRIFGRVAGRLSDEPGATKRVVFLDESDQERELELTLGPPSGQPVKFGNLPTFFSRFDMRQVELPAGDMEAGVVWFNFWMVPLVRKIDAAVDEYRGMDGIVIDLRGNGGGVGAMVSGVAGHFLDERISLGTFITRTTELEIRANPRRVAPDGSRVEPYAGPVAILIDGLTGSASEIFAGGMQAIGRARVFGTTSAGAVLPATMDRLPNGDVLYHAFANFIAADGVRLEGRGVVPDEEVTLSRDDLLAGRDAVLQAALGWIAVERARGPAASGAQR
jgi:carboxyl-terminal processing protease